MFVRVYDKDNDRYYKSIVYGLINPGFYEQYIVINPYTNCFELVDYLDRTQKPPIPLVKKIQNDRENWITYEKVSLLKYKSFCKINKLKMNFDVFCGYQFVFDNFHFLSSVLNHKTISLSESEMKILQLPDKDNWNYILTQDDANEFMKLFMGFHDSYIKTLSYQENFSNTKIIAIFDNTCWYGIVELCFEGVIALNIRPPEENYSGEIYDASLIVKDETVFWADSYMETEDFNYDGSFIKALNLKWRKLDE